MSSNISLRSILDANKLTGPNFLDWNQNLRIVLKQENRLYILKNLIQNSLAEDAKDKVRNVDDDEQAECLMLAYMSHELQRQHKNMNAHTRRPRLKRELMEITTFVVWICCGVLAHLESWSMVSTWHVVLYSFSLKWKLSLHT